MTGIEQANGHKPEALTHVLDPALAAAERPDPDALSFDLDQALAAVVALHSVVPEDAYSASYLGTEREGNGVLIDDDGHVLTIGYLINEAEQVILRGEDGGSVPAQVIAYDYETGFGLLRAAGPLGARPLALGDSAAIEENQTVIVASRGGRNMAINGLVVSKREFAGYWEYMLDEAIFTTPPHPAWSGAALIDGEGKLVGIGSLFVQDALPGRETTPGNMFLPIDLLKPILTELLTQGSGFRKPRPWIGIYSLEALGRVLITSLSKNGPAEEAGVEAGDVVLAVNGAQVTGIADMYRNIWSSGSAGITVRFSLLRDNDRIEIAVETADRSTFHKQPRAH